MNSSGLKLQQFYPCTVCTSDGIQWPAISFSHDLMCVGLVSWSILVMIQHQQRGLRDLIRKGEKIEGISVLPRELCMTSASFPLMMSLSTLTEVTVSTAQSQTKMNKALVSTAKPTRVTISGLQSLCLVRENSPQKGDSCLQKLRSNTRTNETVLLCTLTTIVTRTQFFCSRQADVIRSSLGRTLTPSTISPLSHTVSNLSRCLADAESSPMWTS